MKTYLLQLALVISGGLGIGSVIPIPSTPIKIPPQKQVVLQEAQVMKLIQTRAAGPNSLGVTIGGTGTIDGAYRAYHDTVANVYIISLANPGHAWPQSKIFISPGWAASGWYQTSDAGYATDGTAFIGHGFAPNGNLLPGLPLIGTDPITAGGTVSGSGPWGLTGKTITVSVSP